jgi:hypothetical protein
MSVVHASRRTFLRGAGALLALPWLSSSVRGTEPVLPKRLLYFIVPNGMYMPSWLPTGAGLGWLPSDHLLPLARHRDALTVLTGVANHPFSTGEAHMAAGASVLTGFGADLMAEVPFAPGVISADQLAAAHVGGGTRLPSLELGSEEPMACEAQPNAGAPACSFLWTVSYADHQTPVFMASHLRQAFERVFGSVATGADLEAAERRVRLRQSVLDAVLEDVHVVRARVGAADKERLDDYLTHVRSLEQRLDEATVGGEPCHPAVLDLAARPAVRTGIADVPSHVDAMVELMALALHCDATRVVTYMLGNLRSARALPHLGVPEGHHTVSHHQGRPDLVAAYQTVGRWEVEVFAGLLDRMRTLIEPDGSTLLDQTAAVLLSSMGDGSEHYVGHIPLVIAGRLGGELVPGGHVALAEGTPLSRVHLTLLQKLGAPVTQFGALGSAPLTELG